MHLKLADQGGDRQVSGAPWPASPAELASSRLSGKSFLHIHGQYSSGKTQEAVLCPPHTLACTPPCNTQTAINTYNDCKLDE